jgi:hypothetical protein
VSSIINTAPDRTFVYEDSPFQFIDAGGLKSLALVKNWTFTPNMSDFDIDRIDTSTPIFTKKSDVIGTFSFDTVNTVDFYDAGSTTTPTTYNWWATQIAIGDPPSVTFLVTMRAPKSTGDQFARITFVGRIMSIPLNRLQDTGVHTFTVNGEITSITTIARAST